MRFAVFKSVNNCKIIVPLKRMVASARPLLYNLDSLPKPLKGAPRQDADFQSDVRATSARLFSAPRKKTGYTCPTEIVCRFPPKREPLGKTPTFSRTFGRQASALYYIISIVCRNPSREPLGKTLLSPLNNERRYFGDLPFCFWRDVGSLQNPLADFERTSDLRSASCTMCSAFAERDTPCGRDGCFYFRFYSRSSIAALREKIGRIFSAGNFALRS